MKRVFSIRVSEFSFKSNRSVLDGIYNLCRKYNVKVSIEELTPLFGYKYAVIMDGRDEDIDLVVKFLRISYKVKEK